MIVLGFTIPTFFNDEPLSVEPRICQNDAECYLMCGEEQDEPVMVLCTENLCQQNNCEEETSFPYQEEPLAFELTVENLTLTELSSPGNLFVKFNDNQIRVYTAGLSMENVLEKLNYPFSEKKMKIEINGEESDYYGSYVPQSNDKIKIRFS